MTSPPRQNNIFLPNFCSSNVVLAVVLIMQLVAFLLLLAGRVSDSLLWQRLLLLSLYLHWIGLTSTAALCAVRHRLSGLSSRAAILASYGLLLGVTLVISESAWQIARWQDLADFLPDQAHAAFLIRNLAVCAIVSALALRYFWLQSQWRGQVRAEGTARFQALQARIRPHFLFNSLNSIAALISSQPQAAETAVEDLAQLFRAGLAANERQVSLQEELDVTRAYLRTESLRLGQRLRLRWDIGEGLGDLPVPPLCLQPLLENAVTHGIEALPDGGEIRVVIQKHDRQLQISVENPVPIQPRSSSGAQSALDNIRQRLVLMHGEQARLELGQDNDCFTVRLTLPVVASQAQS